GQGKGGHQQQPGVAHLPDQRRKLAHARIQHLRQAIDLLFLAVIAADLVEAVVDGDVDHSHRGLPYYWAVWPSSAWRSRAMVALSRAAMPDWKACISAWLAFAAASSAFSAAVSSAIGPPWAATRCNMSWAAWVAASWPRSRSHSSRSAASSASFAASAAASPADSPADSTGSTGTGRMSPSSRSFWICASSSRRASTRAACSRREAASSRADCNSSCSAFSSAVAAACCSDSRRNAASRWSSAASRRRMARSMAAAAADTPECITSFFYLKLAYEVEMQDKLRRP